MYHNSLGLNSTKKEYTMTQTSRPARLAFIGCGGHATANLYPSIPLLEGKADLVAACDIDSKRLERAAHLFAIPRTYTDMDAMLDQEELDGVLVIGPPQVHSEIGSRVLARGIPIFVEKPSAIDLATALELARTAERHGTFGMIAFMKRFSVGYRMAKHLAGEPGFGGVQMIDAKFAQGAYPQIWGLSSPELSFLTGQVIHIFDLVRFFGGDVAEVRASYRSVAPERFGFFVQLRFKGGAIGIMNLNTLDARDPWRDFEEHLVVTGVDNAVRVEDMLYLTSRSAQDWIEVPDLSIGRLEKTWRPTGPATRKNEELIGYAGEIAHFAQCVISKTIPVPDLWDAAAAQQLAEATWQCARSSAPVAIEPLR